MRHVDSSHHWNNDNFCKGCGVHIHDEAATKPCEKPYAPPPRLAKEYRKP